MPDQSLPLAGIRVIDFTHFLAGPYLTRCLAALGAEVIKVERPPAGDEARTHPYLLNGQSGYYLQQNMGKKGLCLNLKDPRGLEVLHKLTRVSDVFVENYRPGVPDRLRLGYQELSTINPALIYCSVSAYGHTGPDAGRPGYGLIAEAKSGVMDLVGVPGEAPPLLRVPVADMFAGIHGVAAVCAALVGRQATGRGRHIDMALYDCMVALHEFAVQCYTLSGGKEILVRSGHDLPQSSPYGVFPARDGYIGIAAHMEDGWKRLATLLGGESLAADPRFKDLAGRNAHREELLQRIREWTLAQPSLKECVAGLDAAGVPCAPVQRIDQVVADPQVRARGMVFEQEHPVLGRILMPNVPFKFSDVDVTPHTPAPLMGQHNREILGELLEYAPAQIAELERDGVLYAEEAVGRLALDQEE
jgi:crotonobetainyl-CoA:carnitine CoA-transferase CaiB-like acyl-CoA transferase